MSKTIFSLILALLVAQSLSATTTGKMFTVNTGVTATNILGVTTSGVAPVPVSTPSTSTPAPIMLNALKDASFDDKCLAKILEMGLFKLPQITGAATKIGFTSLKTQVTVGISYQIDYAGAGYTARIRGTCMAVNNSISLDEASYTKV